MPTDQTTVSAEEEPKQLQSTAEYTRISTYMNDVQLRMAAWLSFKLLQTKTGDFCWVVDGQQEQKQMVSEERVRVPIIRLRRRRVVNIESSTYPSAAWVVVEPDGNRPTDFVWNEALIMSQASLYNGLRSCVVLPSPRGDVLEQNAIRAFAWRRPDIILFDDQKLVQQKISNHSPPNADVKHTELRSTFTAAASHPSAGPSSQTFTSVAATSAATSTPPSAASTAAAITSSTVSVSAAVSAPVAGSS
jgi:hypothetical protein